MSRKAVAVAGLSAIAIAASGCGGDSDPEAEFRTAFKKRFGQTTWYHHITGMEVADGRLKITTDHDSKSARRGTASSVPCGVAFRFALDHGLGDGVVLIASDGVEMGGCG